MTPHILLLAAWVVSVVLGGVLGAWIMHPIAFDRGFEEACGNKRHRHRVGSPQETTLLELPRAGRLALDSRPPEPKPGPEWTYFGAQPQPVGPAEYELMTRPSGQVPPWEPDQAATVRMGITRTSVQVEVSGDTRTEETPSAWTRRQALEMDAFIKSMTEQSNCFQHAILAGHLSRRGGGEAGAETQVLARTADGTRHGRHEAAR